MTLTKFSSQSNCDTSEWFVVRWLELLWKKGLLYLGDKLKGALDKYNIILSTDTNNFLICIPFKALVWVMPACWFLPSSSAYFWRNFDIFGIFHFLKLTSEDTQYSGLCETLGMMLIIKYLIKGKCVGRINWNFIDFFWSSL